MAKASRALLRRIRTVQNTRRITKTMELVSASKLKRATDRVAAARPYAEALREVLGDLVTPDLVERFPLLRQPPPPAKGGPARAAVLLATSNRGLAGAFNANLIKEARRRIAALEAEGYTVDVYAIGKKGAGYFRYTGRKPVLDRQDIGDRPTAAHATELAAPLIEAYVRGELGRVEFVHANYRSALSTPPQMQQSRKIRQALSLYEQSKDLIALGAYAAGLVACGGAFGGAGRRRCCHLHFRFT